MVDGESVDRLLVVDFKDLQLLRKEGGSYYSYQGENKDIFPVKNVGVKQSYIESSNVNPTEEMIKMIETFRAFESVQKAIQAMDKITDKMVNDYGLIP